jgi:hypothetical protein
MRKSFIVLALTCAFWASAQSSSPLKCRPAPEPLTLVGLAVGAGIIVFARWRSNRK